MSNYIEQKIDTPFGELCILVDANSKKPIEDAKSDLLDSIYSAKIQESYKNENDEIYALEISFYYGKEYLELDNPVNDESDALDVAIESLISKVNEH